uniref:Uncharacterized protein n=1 Tax=Brassica oleracea TaxID=3712 RepID=A0A3P6E437_BRAOL|nr:unnamed protein product [Brassica oleracea]
MRNDQPPTAISLNSFEIVSGNAIAEIGRLLMFEASRECLPMVVGEIMTPVGAASVELIERISFGSVLQACLMPCVHSVASVSQHRSICVKGNLVMKGNLFLRYVPHSLANSLDKMFYIEILTIICFFGETKDSNHYLFEGMVSRGRTFYATILTSKQQFHWRRRNRTGVDASVSCRRSNRCVFQLWEGRENA